MTAPRDADHLIRAYLDEGMTQLPDRSYDSVRAHIDRTHQRVVIGPWRMPQMSSIARIALGAAAVAIAAVAVAVSLPNNTSQVGPPIESPIMSPTPSPTDQVDTTAWTTFTSPRYGFSARYPTTFASRPSALFWTIPEEPAAGFDYFYGGPGLNNWLAASMVLPNGTTEDEWIAAYTEGMMAGDPSLPAECFAPRADWAPVTIDGHAGGLRTGCGTLDVVLFVDDRVYDFGAYGPPNDGTVGVPDEFRALFEAWLTTITIDPAAALQDPAGPSPS
jgi:hypothetical protein